MKNSCSDAKMADSPEESSWTFYIEGFMFDQNNNKDDEHENCSYSSDYDTPSLVSDAASSPVKKTNSLGFSSGYKNNRKMISKQNSFKKQVRNTVMDLDLEDTASSPVNSPRVSYMTEFMNKRQNGKLDAAEVKRNIFGQGTVQLNNVERETALYTDVKRTIV